MVSAKVTAKDQLKWGAGSEEWNGFGGGGRGRRRRRRDEVSEGEAHPALLKGFEGRGETQEKTAVEMVFQMRMAEGNEECR